MDTLYDGELRETWMNGLTPMDEMNIRHLLVLFGLLGVPESYLDVGCGTGMMVRTAMKLGVRAYGIDQLVEPDWGDNFFHHNLVDHFTFPFQPVDIVTCFEVGEHLDASAHATFCDTLCNSIKPGLGHYLIFSAARPGQGGTGHIACVVEGTNVSASFPRMASRRFYNGQVVTIVTRNGNNLTVTPNHPILTEIGWVGAGFLNEGDYLVGGSFRQRESVDVVPDYHERPTRVEEIFRSFSKLSHALRLSVPLTPKDFHGDAIEDSNVDIIYADCFAKNGMNPAFFQPVSHPFIKFGNPASGNFHRSGSLFQTGNRMFPSHPCSIGFLSQKDSFVRSQTLHPEFPALGSISNLDPIPFESSRNTTVRDTKSLRDLYSRFPVRIAGNDVIDVLDGGKRFAYLANSYAVLDKDSSSSPEVNMRLLGQVNKRLSGGISFDKIIKIERSNFSGHVYNLETNDGWYIANNIITHNCRPAEYWHQEMLLRGMSYDGYTTMNLAHLFSNMRSSLNYLWDNLIVFQR